MIYFPAFYKEVLKSKNLKVKVCSLLFLFYSFIYYLGASKCYAQTFNGKYLYWDVNTDPRLDITFYSTGRSFGSESVSLRVKNMSSKKLILGFQIEIEDFCSGIKTKKIYYTLNPNEKKGTNAWSDGFEFETECIQRKLHGEKFRTSIKQINVKLTSISESAYNSGNATSGSNSSNEGTEMNGNTVSGDQDLQTSNYDIKCKPVVIGLNGTPSRYCANVIWPCEQQVTYVNGNKIHSSPDKVSRRFLIQYKKVSDLQWITNTIDGCPLTFYSLTKLEPCIDYQIRVFSICGSFNSAPSNLLLFTTSCDAPTSIKIRNTSSNSISLSARIVNGSIPCATIQYPLLTSVQYKSSKSTNWNERSFNWGDPLLVDQLLSNELYVFRLRYKYPNGKWSKFSNTILSTTLQ